MYLRLNFFATSGQLLGNRSVIKSLNSSNTPRPAELLASLAAFPACFRSVYIGGRGFASLQSGLFGDSAALEIPSAILFRVIDFMPREGDERNTNGCLHFTSNI
jgi:hypothetical protein